jgi:hypothetical protein
LLLTLPFSTVVQNRLAQQFFNSLLEVKQPPKQRVCASGSATANAPSATSNKAAAQIGIEDRLVARKKQTSVNDNR